MASRFRQGFVRPPRQTTVRLSKQQVQKLEDAIDERPTQPLIDAIEDALYWYQARRQDEKAAHLGARLAPRPRRRSDARATDRVVAADRPRDDYTDGAIEGMDAEGGRHPRGNLP